jgi:hypothetical protein
VVNNKVKKSRRTVHQKIEERSIPWHHLPPDQGIFLLTSDPEMRDGGE